MHHKIAILKSKALLDLINDHSLSKNVVKIEQKFQEPGHSCVQEMDFMHRTTDGSLSRADISTPLDFTRKVLKVRTKKIYIMYQMKEEKWRQYKFKELTLHQSETHSRKRL